MSERLAGHVSIVTGAARGQGAAIARRFVSEGAVVVLTDVLRREGQALADELGDRACFASLDVTSESQWLDAVGGATTRFGRLDVLVNNAGMVDYEPFETTSLDRYMRQVMIDQVGVFLGMRAVLPAMRAAGRGSIINTASTSGHLGQESMAAYGAAKQAVRAMTRTAAVEWGRDRIRVNAIVPGAIRTQMLEDLAPAGSPAEAAIASSVPLGRVGEPDEIARLAAFLASEESSYCTGADFFCDGGLSIWRGARNGILSDSDNRHQSIEELP